MLNINRMIRFQLFGINNVIKDILIYLKKYIQEKKYYDIYLKNYKNY